MKSEWQKLRGQIPCGDYELAEYCRANLLAYETVMRWDGRHGIKDYWFSEETLKEVVRQNGCSTR